MSFIPKQVLRMISRKVFTFSKSNANILGSLQYFQNQHIIMMVKCCVDIRTISISSALDKYKTITPSTTPNIERFTNNYHTEHIDRILVIFAQHNVEPSFILDDNPWLFDMKEDELNKKLELLKEMHFKQIADSIAFLKLPFTDLLKIFITTRNDHKRKYFEYNRLYYLSDKLKCDPYMLSQYVAKRTFIFKNSFTWIKASLDVLLATGVDSQRIINDLWILKYHHETVRERLQRVKDTGRNGLAPWMARCKSDVLQRTIRLTSTTKEILGDRTPSIYLAERLGTTPEVVAEMHKKTPSLKSTRVMKLKNILDFMLSQGFSPEEIIRVPRIFAPSLETIRSRLLTLRAAGIDERNLHILCWTKKAFKKYYENITRINNKLMPPSTKMFTLSHSDKSIS